MTQSPMLLDLSIVLNAPPANEAPEMLASITLHCEALGLTHQGELLFDPLTQQERDDLRWYLEQYPLWPYAEFVTRGQQIEAHLAEIGQRLYRNVFGSPQAASIVQAWNLQPCDQRQVSILSPLPAALSLPWELLHDEQGFLAIRTHQQVAIVRSLPQRQLPGLLTPLEPPLRILFVTARPEGTGFFDPRGIARELLDVLQEQIEAGTIALEFLRPPTMRALHERLRESKRPVHILHFDGHGIFRGEQGRLAFEKPNGRLDLVAADDLAQVLLDSGVKLVVLDACQSALSSSDNVFSSVAARLIQAGIDATIAMGATVLVASTTRFFKAFYQELARNTPVAQAIERARQQLQDDPRRFLFSPHQQEEGQPMILRDWWLPHYYQQRPLALTLNQPQRGHHTEPPSQSILPRLNNEMPAAPRYQFSGRSRELLQIERHLLHGKLVILSGFGGIGKTTLAREVADWLTRSGLYQQACFVSFEHGGDASTLLSTLGHYLGIADSDYNPNEPQATLDRLRTILNKRRILLIADNLESILPGGEAPLPPEARIQLWDVLLKLAMLRAGILLTSRDPNAGDGRFAPGAQAAVLSLQGLLADDAYELATRLLTKLNIDRAQVPYAELRDLLSQLDHHPLAIQLVLPALRTTALTCIRTDFAALLPTFVDDQASVRNHSLLTSLTYSLQRLSEEQRTLLPRLSIFEGGACEYMLLAITEIPEQDWLPLRQALQQAALLVIEQVHEAIDVSFLRFHPVLIPFLRDQPGAEDAALYTRYTRHYYTFAYTLYHEDHNSPQQARIMALKELPNLRHALALLLAEGTLDGVTEMAEYITKFLDVLGLVRERSELQQRVSAFVAKQEADQRTDLTHAAWTSAMGLAKNTYDRSDLPAAITHFEKLLTRIEAQPEGTPLGRGSFEHFATLLHLARCFGKAKQPSREEQLQRHALSIIDALLKQQPENTSLLRQRGALLNDLGNNLFDQGAYAQAQTLYEEAVVIDKQLGDVRGEAVNLLHLGKLAAQQGAYAVAKERYTEALTYFRALDEPKMEAEAWFQLGSIAQEQRNWSEAEQCYRANLAIMEQLGYWSDAADTYNRLGVIAELVGRPDEAEKWYRRALELNARTHPASVDEQTATILNNLAYLLINEIQAGRADKTCLGEARRYAEQALEIKTQLDVSSDIWKNLGVLAAIADMEGQEEETRALRRREREAYATITDHRQNINRRFSSLIEVIAKAAQGHAQAKEIVEEAFPTLEKKGRHIAEAMRRILVGERDWHILAEKLDNDDALLILRVLETLAQPTPTSEEDIAGLPQRSVRHRLLETWQHFSKRWRHPRRMSGDV